MLQNRELPKKLSTAKCPTYRSLKYLQKLYELWFSIRATTKVLRYSTAKELAIIDSVDSICRDGTDTPISLKTKVTA